MEVDQLHVQLNLNASSIVVALHEEFSAITDYRTLRDSFPRRLAVLLKCRCVLLYQRLGETLQFASGSYDDVPGWSAGLLQVAHINPIDCSGSLPEAQAVRERHAINLPGSQATPALVAAPLAYRHRTIGVLTVLGKQHHANWTDEDVEVIEAVSGVVALLLENTRLLERDRERISELSLLNSITSQLNLSMYDFERAQRIIIQRSMEITSADLCELLRPTGPVGPGGPGSHEHSSLWMTPRLRDKLITYFNEQRQGQSHPLIIERPGDAVTLPYLDCLPSNIKTFFAIPLFTGESRLAASTYQPGTAPWRDASAELVAPSAGHAYVQACTQGSHLPYQPLQSLPQTQSAKRVTAIIAGAFYRSSKLHRDELVMLQMLAGQASAVLENMSLIADVLEARNEARRLLRQVLDDQRLKELILENMPGGLITVDLSGRITAFNRSAASILGYHPYEVMGKPLQEILHITLPGQQQLQSAESLPAGETLLTVDQSGREVVLDMYLIPLHNDQSIPIGVLLTFSDVTAMRHLEEEKRRLDRLASLGEMSANVAHEVRNPLASIKTSMQMLKADLQDVSPLAEGAQESVTIALKEVERLDAIVRDLLLFARPRQLHLVSCNLISISEHVLQLMQAQCAASDVKVHRAYYDVPSFPADIAQIEQILFNLYMNALQAMPDGGVLSVSCRRVAGASVSATPRPREQAVAREFGAARGVSTQQDWLELAVSDTGVGIAPDQLERLFQPFYTTRAHGIGLGLPITRRLIEDHRGHIAVDSQLGYGATFTVRFPLDASDFPP